MSTDALLAEAYDPDAEWWREQYDDELAPTMYEVRWGFLLKVLTKLEIRKAKTLLDEWYW